MVKDREFEYIIEVDRKYVPTPQELIEDPSKFYVERKATSDERLRILSLVEEIRLAQGGRSADIDDLLSRLSSCHPLTAYLEWYTKTQDLNEKEKERIENLTGDLRYMIFTDDGPFNLMGHFFDIHRRESVQPTFLNNLRRFLHGN